MRYLRSLFPDRRTGAGSKTIFAVILLIALAVRLIGIASRPIWYDEAFAILFSQKGPAAMLYGTLAPTGTGSADIHPLGYYTLLWLWMMVFDDSLTTTRAFSILAGLLSTGLIYLIALESFEATTARLSMLISALMPLQIHYAQEIRMYSFLAMWLLLATYAYLRGAKTGRWGWWLIFSVSAALAQYTHNLAAFYLIPLALTPAFRKDWKTLRAVILAGILAVLLYTPWLIQLPAQFANVQQGYWVERPEIFRLLTLLLVYMTNTPLPDNWIMPALLIALTVLSIGLMQTMRTARRMGGSNGIWMLYLSFAPPMFLFLFSQWKPVYVERALLPSGAIFGIWLGWVLTSTNLSKQIRYILLGMIGVTFAMGIYEHLTYRDFPYGPYRALNQSLRERLEAGDVIVHSNKLTMLPALYFDRDLAQTFIGDPPGGRTDTLAPPTQQVLGIKAETDIQSATAGARRVWFVIFQRAMDEYQAAGKSHPDIEFLGSQFTLELEESWDGLRVFLYTKKP
jgi:mannosyltransferase